MSLFVETVVKWVIKRVFSPKTQRFHKIPVRREYTLHPFFRSTLAYWGKIIEEESESPKRIKILVTVFTFQHPVKERKLQPYIDDVLIEYVREWQEEADLIQSGYEAEQVGHDEARGLGFYRVAVTVDDEEIRRERLS